MMPDIPGLRAENWARSSGEGRLKALSNLENFLAEQEGRQPCQVIMSADLPDDTLGVYYFRDGIETIALNPKIIVESEAELPYLAVETLFHESRHAYQHHVVENPEFAEDQTQLEDWQLSANGGYIPPDGYIKDKVINYLDYRWQPTESDANEVSRSRTDELYQETFQDTDRYPEYKTEQERTLNLDIAYAKGVIGENYKEAARQAMIEHYQESLKTQEAPEINQGSSAGGEETSLSEGEDYDHGYGYGYY